MANQTVFTPNTSSWASGVSSITVTSVGVSVTAAQLTSILAAAAKAGIAIGIGNPVTKGSTTVGGIVQDAVNPIIITPPTGGSDSSTPALKSDINAAVATAATTVASGTTTLVAGTKAVTNTAITATSYIRFFHYTVGGTIGILSVTRTAGTGFTLNSSSNTDTSIIYYEVVAY